MIRVLVVDDDFRVARLHADFVSSLAGFTVAATAAGLREASNRLQQGGVDLVLLDSYLPDGSGVEFLTRMAARDCDVLVLSADNSADAVRRALRHGAVDYLIKPFEYAELGARLLAYARFRAAWREGELTQVQVDRMLGLLREGSRRPVSSPTAIKVEEALMAADEPVSAADLAAQVGIGRATAQRYLSRLLNEGRARVEPRYGSTGRPELRYLPVEG